MQPYSHLRQYTNLADFSLEWEILQTKIMERIKTRILTSNPTPEIVWFMRQKMWQNHAGHGW